MSFLTKKQLDALKLWKEGKKKGEIARELEIHPSSASEAVARGKRNIEKTINTVEILLSEGLFNAVQISRLKFLIKEGKFQANLESLNTTNCG